jgi:phosphoribosylamine---glycine ligase
MIAEDGTPTVLEYNCRLGDPETQPILMRLESDLLGLVEAAQKGRLRGIQVQWSEQPSVGVVLAAEGYPGRYETGLPVEIGAAAKQSSVKIFHAGTAFDGRALRSAGGRVLCVTALGDDLAGAQSRVYAALPGIVLEGGFFRHDIGGATGGARA